MTRPEPRVRLSWRRRIAKLYANLFGFFWLPCPLCGQMFGGHESRWGVLAGRAVCFRCDRRQR